ncbi:hypothetical protein GCM10009021_19460 [Halarchaeum nitratireducens]|uniref:MarR family transcriptional regulator n=1 Tax=Halarchaeum nitratireducens TaxID=489913 RepID=A0A830GBI4_9EURY|nr:hypothetical protein GCM10009021_19460 [Halarchaeum nitratireducens]
MRLAGSWQVLLDDRILEYFVESDEEFLQPGEIAEDDRIRYSRAYVSKRCVKLADHGLLQAIKQGVYRITDEGRGYLNGEYDVETGVWVDQANGKSASAGVEDTTEV